MKVTVYYWWPKIDNTWWNRLADPIESFCPQLLAAAMVAE